MNRNVMIVLAGGFLIALLVALLVQASLSGGKKAEPVAQQEEPKVEIIVASKDLKTGATLNDTNMKWHDWPKRAVFPGAIVREDDKKPSELIEGRLRREVKAGEPIVESALVPKDEGNFLAASLKEGMRAVSIKVSASTMVGGFVGPGDFVDVLLTYKEKFRYDTKDHPEIKNKIEMALDNLATETILQNVKVLAVDQANSRGEDDKIKPGKTVTLEVDYKGAEVLALGGKMGDLSLALRRLGDETMVKKKPPVTTDARVVNIDNEIFDEIAKSSDISGKSGKIVRIYRGDKVEDIDTSK